MVPDFAKQARGPDKQDEEEHGVAERVLQTGPEIERAEILDQPEDQPARQGAGDGPITAVMPIVPSLVSPQVQGRNDGYIYAIITNGRGLMKQYRQRVRSDDRWHIVNYIRILQGIAQ